MFKKVLIANRGEIAVQVIRNLHEMNIKAVCVYSSADADSLFVKLADEAICIGQSQPSESYLNMLNIITAATLTGCEAIHPGYGFLSENSEFARLCTESKLIFIGPNYQTISLMGNKAHARKTMKKAGIPIIPGSDGTVADIKEALQVAQKIGYPVMLKAEDGGGGKGIRRIDNAHELQKAYVQATQEALNSFGDAKLYLEKIIDNAKHIEVQILGDEFGNYVYFPERDCSMQRNHQKVIEESPCASVTESERQKIGEIAIKAAKAIDYVNTGTMEFLMDEQHHFYFMEMNTRLQVEYGVTEAVSGVELIKEQIKVANHQPLMFKQADLMPKGHAIECRINAENPHQNFMPSAGTIEKMFLSTGTLGVRIDTGFEAQSQVPPFYDSMIAKIIVHLSNRTKTINKLQRVIAEVNVQGININQQFLSALLADKTFQNGNFNTMYIENEFLKKWLQHEK